MAPAIVNQSSKSVCVMDASGRLGTTLVHRLLQRGYIVHAALHNYHHLHHDIDEFLKTLEGGDESKKYKKKLKVLEADPLDYHSIMDALKGCSALFYSFDPPPQQPSYDVHEFVDELEVRAAHNVVEACAQTDTIQKVVFTSSATAVIWRDHHQEGDDHLHVIDETNWSDISFCKKFKLWHGLAKTMAEKAAWSLAMDRGLNMVTINSGLVMSPDLTIKEPYLKGAAEMFEDGILVTVDLKFLVDAHICVFEDVSSYGRYLCFNRAINSTKDAVKLANMLLPPSSSNHQNQSLDDKKSNHQHARISNKKLCKLMVDYDYTSSQLVD